MCIRDRDSLKTKMDALEQAANAMAQQMYQQGGAAQGNQGYTGSTGSTSSNDDVMDADFQEKN